MQDIADKMHRVTASARTTKQRQAAKRYYDLYKALVDRTRRRFVRRVWVELILILVGAFIVAVLTVSGTIILW